MPAAVVAFYSWCARRHSLSEVVASMEPTTSSTELAWLSVATAVVVRASPSCFQSAINSDFVIHPRRRPYCATKSASRGGGAKT